MYVDAVDRLFFGENMHRAAIVVCCLQCCRAFRFHWCTYPNSTRPIPTPSVFQNDLVSESDLETMYALPLESTVIRCQLSGRCPSPSLPLPMSNEHPLFRL